MIAQMVEMFAAKAVRRESSERKAELALETNEPQQIGGGRQR
jgi:hypothetical protein